MGSCLLLDRDEKGDGMTGNEYPALAPINPAAFGYCTGWVLLVKEGGRVICANVFGQHQYKEAREAINRERNRPR